MATVKFTMRLVGAHFELISGNWPSREGQLWNGWCEFATGPNVGKRWKCQAAGNADGHPTFYWGW